MSGYVTYQLAKIRQHELIAAADSSRRIGEARLGSQGAALSPQRPLFWLREAAGGIAARLVSPREESWR